MWESNPCILHICRCVDAVLVPENKLIATVLQPFLELVVKLPFSNGIRGGTAKLADTSDKWLDCCKNLAIGVSNMLVFEDLS